MNKLFSAFDAPYFVTRFVSLPFGRRLKLLVLASLLGLLAASFANAAIVNNEASFVSLDLSKFANSRLNDSILYHTADSSNHLAELPAGRTNFGNTPFNV